MTSIKSLTLTLTSKKKNQQKRIHQQQQLLAKRRRAIKRLSYNGILFVSDESVEVKRPVILIVSHSILKVQVI